MLFYQASYVTFLSTHSRCKRLIKSLCLRRIGCCAVGGDVQEACNPPENCRASVSEIDCNGGAAFIVGMKSESLSPFFTNHRRDEAKRQACKDGESCCAINVSINPRNEIGIR